MRKTDQRNFGDLPKAHNLEAADNGTKSHTFRLKTGLFIPYLQYHRTIDPKPRLGLEEWKSRPALELVLGPASAIETWKLVELTGE